MASPGGRRRGSRRNGDLEDQLAQDGVAEILTGETADPPPEPVPVEEGTPKLPTAQPVPDKPGFVISPFNGKWIDVTDYPVGSTVADPHFPSDEKKYFLVPEPLPVPEPGTPVPEPVETDPAADSSGN